MFSDLSCGSWHYGAVFWALFGLMTLLNEIVQMYFYLDSDWVVKISEEFIWVENQGYVPFMLILMPLSNENGVFVVMCSKLWY